MSSITNTPGWVPDPTGHHELRYWDGTAWTAHVADRGVPAEDPLAVARPAAAPTQPPPTPAPAAPAPAAPGTTPALAPGWYPDPLRHAGSRWWDGRGWTTHAATDGQSFEDALVAPGAPTPPLQPALTATPFAPPAGGRRPRATVWVALGAVAVLVVAVVVVLATRGRSGTATPATSPATSVVRTTAPATSPTTRTTLLPATTTTVTATTATTTAAPSTAATTVPFTLPTPATVVTTAAPATVAPTVAPTASPTVPGATWVACSSPSQGFTVSYPATWSLYHPSDDSMACGLFSPTPFTATDDDSAFDEAWIDMGVDHGTTIKNFEDDYLATKDWEGTPTVEHLTIAGHDAILVTAVIPAGGMGPERWGVRQYAIELVGTDETDLFVLEVMRPLGTDYTQAVSVQEGMLASLQLPTG